MKHLFILIVPLLLSFLYARPATADSDLLSLGVGKYDIGDNHSAQEFRLEYRWDKPLIWVIEPWAGAEVTDDGAIYALGGALADFQIGHGFLITPSVGAGLYSDGGGKDLGGALQFRTQLEMGWELKNDHRVGVAYSHISNAGLTDPNPGTQVLGLYYHLPVGN